MDTRKRMMGAAIVCLLFLAFLGGSTPRLAAQQQEIVLSVLSCTDEMRKFADEFERQHTNIRIDLTIIARDDYPTKLMPLLRSGKHVPDVFTAEYSTVGELMESGYYDDLGENPYNADTSEIYPYIIKGGTDSKGKLRVLSWQACVGGIFYRRSVAKKYLVTDDPGKIGAMLSTPAKFLATARLLKQKSGGSVKLISSYNDYQQIAFTLRKQAFVTGDKLNIEQCILNYFDLAKTMVDEKLTADLPTWSPPWFENMNKKTPEFMCYILPTWGPVDFIEPNAKDTMGDWGLCEILVPYFWESTWVGIYKDSKVKKLAWQFVKFMTLERNTQQWWAKETGELVSNKAVVEKIKGDFSSKLLGGQNYYEVFARQALKINGSPLGKYGPRIWLMLLGAIDNYVQGQVTKAEACAKFKADVKNYFPDIEVE